MTNQEWFIQGEVTEELVNLFDHGRHRNRVRRVLDRIQPHMAEFVRQGDFFMLQVYSSLSPVTIYRGFAKRNPTDKFRVTEAKKVALYRLVQSVEEETKTAR